MRSTHIAWFAVAFSLLPGPAALAQEPPLSPATTAPPAASADASADEADHPVEGLPLDILRETGKLQKVLADNGLSGPRATTRGVFTSLYRWNRSFDPINVCFFGGTTEQRKLVVDVASEWTKIGAHIPLSFGADPTTPATCTGSSPVEHIRVAFHPDGTIWSAIGMESIKNRRAFPRHKPSMNLGYKPSLGATKIRRAILHEFGHALGLEHEHQHPDLKCWPDEFDTEALRRWLQTSKGWTSNHIEANLALINRGGTLGIETTDFDKQAVMIYGFPARFYKKRLNSHCFAHEKAEISAAERALMIRLYPPRIEVAEALETRRRAFWRERLAGLPGDDGDGARRRGGTTRGGARSGGNEVDARALIEAFLDP